MSENGHDDHVHSEDGAATEGYAHAHGPGQPTHTHGPGGHSHSDAFAQKEGRWAQAAEERISLVPPRRGDRARAWRSDCRDPRPWSTGPSRPSRAASCRTSPASAAPS